MFINLKDVGEGASKDGGRSTDGDGCPEAESLAHPLDEYTQHQVSRHKMYKFVMS